jgi:hypothetical protein
VVQAAAITGTFDSTAAASISTTWFDEAALGVRIVLEQVAAAAGAVGLVLTPSKTATQDEDSGEYFYHGTATFSGGPLDAAAAAEYTQRLRVSARILSGN